MEIQLKSTTEAEAQKRPGSRKAAARHLPVPRTPKCWCILLHGERLPGHHNTRPGARNQRQKHPFLSPLCNPIASLLLLRCCENTYCISSEVSLQFLQLTYLARQIPQPLPLHFFTFLSSSNFSCALYPTPCYLPPHLSLFSLPVITTLALMLSRSHLLPSYSFQPL